MLNIPTFRNYLIIVNILGFILYLINKWLYDNTHDGQIDKILTILSILGGSGGILLAILIFDRKPEKENMMSRVFIACIFVIQCILLLIINGKVLENITIKINDIFDKYRVLLIYLGIINIITFIAFGIDKYAALNSKSRVRNVTLLGLAFIGGTIGGLLAMYLFKHKTKKDYYSVGLWLMIIMQILVLIYLTNLK